MGTLKIAGAILGLALLAGCGSSITPASSPANTSGETIGQICAADPSNAVCAGLDTSGPTDIPTDIPTDAPTPNNLEGPVGTDYTDTDSSGNVMDVVLTQVEDPVHETNQFEAPDNGTRYVAAKFTITGSSGTYSGDANSDAVVIGTDGQTYTFATADVRACTNFNFGSYSVVASQKSIGCVVFQVPNGVKVAQVEWGGEFGGTPAIWDVS